MKTNIFCFLKKPFSSLFFKKNIFWLVFWFFLINLFFWFSLLEIESHSSEKHSFFQKQQLADFQKTSFLLRESDLFLKSLSLKPEISLASQIDFFNSPILDNDNYLISLASFKFSFGKEKGSVLHYQIKRGDTLYGIAKKFSIPLNKLLVLNNLKKNSILREGQEIIISSVSGILYQVNKDEDIERIAQKFHFKKEDLLRFNNLKEEEIKEGKTIVIPGVYNLKGNLKKTKEKLPFLKGYFSLPATGWLVKTLPEKNAVVLSNFCQTPVFSANEGLVVEKETGWNKGYGNYVVVRHPNRTETFYASLDKICVSLGDYVKKGEKIGLMGKSADFKKKNACFLYFSVRGAKNPFLK